MSISIDSIDLVPGEIYVTCGGLVTLKNDSTKQKYPWGYDRVRFMRLTKSHVIVETPWGSECELPLDYKLSSTHEGMIRSEFELSGVHETCEKILFSTALKKGIAKELSAKELQELINIETAETQNTSTTRPSEVARNEFTEKIIKYFEEPRTNPEAAKHFGVAYQKIRYTLKKLKAHGHGLQRFKIETTNDKINKTKLVRI